jgi:3-methyladenine DNA glycosylase AlkD
VLASCQALIERDERFAKTAVGWILRDISKRDPVLVKEFVELKLTRFSLESLRNTLKYFPSEDRDRYVGRLKAAPRAARS